MKLKSLIAVGCLMFGVAMPVHAATIIPSATEIDFGDVALGKTASLPLGWTINLEPGERFFSFEFGISGPFIARLLESECNLTGIMCATVVSFRPRETGEQLGEIRALLEYEGTGGLGIIESNTSISGHGIPPVPIGTTLPLFASGLGALGFIGWRRRRKASVAA